MWKLTVPWYFAKIHFALFVAYCPSISKRGEILSKSVVQGVISRNTVLFWVQGAGELHSFVNAKLALL